MKCGNKWCKIYRSYYDSHCDIAEEYVIDMQEYCKKFKPDNQLVQEEKPEQEEILRQYKRENLWKLVLDKIAELEERVKELEK